MPYNRSEKINKFSFTFFFRISQYFSISIKTSIHAALLIGKNKYFLNTPVNVLRKYWVMAPIFCQLNSFFCENRNTVFSELAPCIT
jgi:hypothetical protein